MDPAVQPATGGDAEGLPLLSKQASELLRMSEEARCSVRLLALVAMQDPVAVARLLSLANSASLSHGRVVADLDVALSRVGSQTAYDVLLKSALLNSVVSKTHPREVDFLFHHIFSMGVTAKKIANAVPRSIGINLPRLVLLSSVEKLGLVWLLSQSERHPAAAGALVAAIAQRSHLYRCSQPLRAWVARSAEIAHAWSLPEFVEGELSSMTQAACSGASLEDLTNEAAALLLAEQYLQLREVGLEDGRLMESLEGKLRLVPTRTSRTELVWVSK